MAGRDKTMDNIKLWVKKFEASKSGGTAYDVKKIN